LTKVKPGSQASSIPISSSDSFVTSNSTKERTSRKITLIEGGKRDQLIRTKFGTLESEVIWLQIWAQTSQEHKDEILQTPMWEIKRYYKQIVTRSIVNSHNPNDPLSKTLTQVLENLYSISSSNQLTSSSPELSTKHSQFMTLATKQPLPIRFELMSEEKINEKNQAAICFECDIISNNNEDHYVLLAIGINMEAERLFGYSKLELFNLFKYRHKFILARLIDSSDWEKVIKRELKASLQGDLAFRLYVTALNKWKCPIKVLLDIRVDSGWTFQKHRTNFFFIPLPLEELAYLETL